MKRLLFVFLLSPLVFSNEMHNELMRMSSQEQRNFWTNFMKKSGEDCVPTKIKFLAVSTYDGGSQWAVGCQTKTLANKDGLWINLKPNGDTKIMECSTLKAFGSDCGV